MAVTKQPEQMLITGIDGHRDWDTGLLSCCTDCKALLCIYCCLPCAIGDISRRTGECPCMPCCVPGGLIAIRARLRTMGGIRGSICKDSIALVCCPLCAVCQMQRELDAMRL